MKKVIFIKFSVLWVKKFRLHISTLYKDIVNQKKHHHKIDFILCTKIEDFVYYNRFHLEKKNTNKTQHTKDMGWSIKNVMGTAMWSWRFFPTPGESWITWIPCCWSCSAGPTPLNISNWGVLIAPAERMTSFLAKTV